MQTPTREALGCHPGCVELSGEHTTKVTRTRTATLPWRSECEDCGTVLALHLTRSTAVTRAIAHAKRPEDHRR